MAYFPTRFFLLFFAAFFAGSIAASRADDTLRKHIELGKYAAQFRDYDRAAQHYEAALKESPRSKTILFTLGALYQKTSEYDKSEKIYKKILEFYPLDSQAHLCLGDLYIANNRLNLAVNELQKATELDRENAAAFRNLGYAQLLGGAINSAKKSLEKAVELNPKDHLALFDLGYTYHKLGKNKQAIKTFQKALAIDNSIAGKTTYTDILKNIEGERLNKAINDFNNNHFEKAKKEFIDLINEFPDHALLYAYLGHTLHFKNPPEPFAAESAYRTAIEKLKFTVLSPTQAAYLYDNIGMIRMNLGDFGEAEFFFKKAVDEDTDYPVCYFNYGCMLARKKLYTAASVAFADAARRDKNFIKYVSTHAALNEFRKTAAFTNFLNTCKQK